MNKTTMLGNQNVLPPRMYEKEKDYETLHNIIKF